MLNTNFTENDNIHIVKKKLEEANNKVKLLTEEMDRNSRDLQILRFFKKCNRKHFLSIIKIQITFAYNFKVIFFNKFNFTFSYFA